MYGYTVFLVFTGTAVVLSSTNAPSGDSDHWV